MQVEIIFVFIHTVMNQFHCVKYNCFPNRILRCEFAPSLLALCILEFQIVMLTNNRVFTLFFHIQ